jgi:hypothetical protein
MALLSIMNETSQRLLTGFAMAIGPVASTRSARGVAIAAVLLMTHCTTPLQATVKPLQSAEQVAVNIDTYMNAAVRVNRFSGTVLVARSGKP